MRRPLFFLLLPLLLILTAPAVLAADDPSIRGELRQGIGQAMSDFIDHQSLDGRYLHYDPVSGELLTLELEELHSGIVQKGDFFVSCADFRDPNGRLVDLDFLVRQAPDGTLRATQALVHKVDGTKRPYHLEEQADPGAGG